LVLETKNGEIATKRQIVAGPGKIAGIVRAGVPF